jgi:hypothetical protein
MIFAFQIVINKEYPQMRALHINKAAFWIWGSHSYSTIFWDVTPVFCQFLSWFTLWPWRWRQHSSPKWSWTSDGLHGILSQETVYFKVQVTYALYCIYKAEAIGYRISHTASSHQNNAYVYNNNINIKAPIHTATTQCLQYKYIHNKNYNLFK